MNWATKAALFNSQANPFHARAAFFHSTPVLDRKRRTSWDSRRNYYGRRFRRLHGKQMLLRNVSAFAEHLFQNWKNGDDDFDPSSGQGSSWFKSEFNARGFKCGSSRTNGPHFSGRRDFRFCEDDSHVETIFHSAFGGNKDFYWSFIQEDFPQWGSSSRYSNNYRTSWNWRYRDEEDYDSSTESDDSYSNFASDRRALGLSTSGPLNLEDVKNAYRSCALKWHPDRHKGSSKAIAEEKFKTCSAAYQSLCDKLTIN